MTSAAATTTGIRYLTGVSCQLTRDARRADLGLLATPASGVHAQRHHYELAGWGADNGCFAETPAKPFDAARWLAWLELVGPAGCHFAALPDVVGDAIATWNRSVRYLAAVRRLGFPVAIVLQDGLEDVPNLWTAVLREADAVFVGGSTEWKVGPAAAELVRQAKRAGKWVHVGRVNSYKRLAYCESIGADSADGTFIGFGPDVNTPKVLGWLDRLAVRQPELVAA